MSRSWIHDDIDHPVAGPSLHNAQDEEADFWMQNDVRRGAAPNIIPQETAEETSLQKLIRHWMNERHAPDILPAQETLLGRLLDHIGKQVRITTIVPLFDEEE